MMKRFLSALAALLLCASCAAGEETGKYDTLPEIFAITVEEAERKIDNGSAYVYKEYVTTVNPEVNAALRALVDGYDEAISPTLEMDPRKKGKRGSALNVFCFKFQLRLEQSSKKEAGYSCRSGQSWQPVCQRSQPARTKWLQWPVSAQQSCSVQTSGTPVRRIQSKNSGTQR